MDTEVRILYCWVLIIMLSNWGAVILQNCLVLLLFSNLAKILTFQMHNEL